MSQARRRIVVICSFASSVISEFIFFALAFLWFYDQTRESINKIVALSFAVSCLSYCFCKCICRKALSPWELRKRIIMLDFVPILIIGGGQVLYSNWDQTILFANAVIAAFIIGLHLTL